MSVLQSAVNRVNKETRGAYVFGMTGKPHIMPCVRAFGASRWCLTEGSCVDVYHDATKQKDAMIARAWARHRSARWYRWSEGMRPKPHLRPRVMLTTKKGKALKHPQMHLRATRHLGHAGEMWRKGKARAWAEWIVAAQRQIQ